MLYLVRHGRPLIDRARPAHEWELDLEYADDVRTLRARLPEHAAWFSSEEPKALATAGLLTDEPIEVVGDLREHERNSTEWVDAFSAVVRRAFEHPEVPAYAGWEPLAATRQRVVTAVEGILDQHPDHDIVLVGHGTAWTLARAELRGEPPDLHWWMRLSLPHVACVPRVGRGDMLNP